MSLIPPIAETFSNFLLDDENITSNPKLKDLAIMVHKIGSSLADYHLPMDSADEALRHNFYHEITLTWFQRFKEEDWDEMPLGNLISELYYNCRWSGDELWTLAQTIGCKIKKGKFRPFDVEVKSK